MREECVTITAFLADFWRIWRRRGTDAPEGGALRGPKTLVVDAAGVSAPTRARLDGSCGVDPRRAIDARRGCRTRAAQAGTAARLGARFGM